MKRLVDFLVSLGGLLLLFPLFLVIALAIVLESTGPVIFSQKRIGRHGTVFEILKFRSMVVDAQVSGPPMTLVNDARITGVGRRLRRFSLDELPQLINVLRGDMSLIGPRPELPSQKELYTDQEWSLRHRVRPGVTGLAQVSGRHELGFEKRKEFDLSYARRSPFSLEVRIVILTLREMILRGA